MFDVSSFVAVLKTTKMRPLIYFKAIDRMKKSEMGFGNLPTSDDGQTAWVVRCSVFGVRLLNTGSTGIRGIVSPLPFFVYRSLERNYLSYSREGHSESKVKTQDRRLRLDYQLSYTWLVHDWLTVLFMVIGRVIRY